MQRPVRSYTASTITSVGGPPTVTGHIAPRSCLSVCLSANVISECLDQRSRSRSVNLTHKMRNMHGWTRLRKLLFSREKVPCAENSKGKEINNAIHDASLLYMRQTEPLLEEGGVRAVLPYPLYPVIYMHPTPWWNNIAYIINVNRENESL